jgi:hypothetical protein
MNRLVVLCFSLIALTSLPGSGALGGPSSAQESEFVALTNEWTAAIIAKDRPKLESLMAPNFTLHAWDESWTGERSKWLKNTMERYHISEYRHTAIVPRIFGDIADVTSKWYWRGTRDKKPFEEHGYVLDVWQQKSGRWQVVSRITIVLPGKV